MFFKWAGDGRGKFISGRLRKTTGRFNLVQGYSKPGPFLLIEHPFPL